MAYSILATLYVGRRRLGAKVIQFIAAVALLQVLVFLAALPPIIRLPSEMKSLVRRSAVVFGGGKAVPIHLPSGPPVLSNRTAMELLIPQLENFRPNVYLYQNRSARYSRSVLAFLHNPKSGGTSMRNCIKALSEAAEKRAPVLVSTKTIPEVRTKLLNHVTEISDYYIGDATIGICDFVDGRPCSYFTLMREPYDRSVSHYYFCKGGGQGWPPCNNTLEEFTLSLCSLFFRQMTTRLFCGHEVEGDNASPWRCNNKVTTIDHGRRRSQEERTAVLEYILENIDKIFAVIGITEDFETSLKLFEGAFGDPFYGLCREKHFNAGRYNAGEDIDPRVSDKQKIRAEAKERLMRNDEVRKCLREDIQIYKKVLDIFETEKRVWKTAWT